MVFGLFSRRQPSPPPEPCTTVAQLRTPSPSIDSVSGKPNSPPAGPPLTPSPPPDPNPGDLHALIRSVPPQTLHAYTLAHLLPHPPPPATLAHLSAFLAQLTPPPRLHCLRCHKSFFDVENTDRSCLVPHDDDSAEVERIPAKRGESLYETLWGCCGRTVEGDGDMGPPDGWCYEGKHTTDAKRARFRADSTLHDDKLTSCKQLRCHEPPRSSRKRGRLVTDDDNDDGEESSASSSVSASTSPQSLKAEGGSKPRRGPAKKPRTQPQASNGEEATEQTQIETDREEMDVDPNAVLSSPPSVPKSKSTRKTRHIPRVSNARPNTRSPRASPSRSCIPTPPSRSLASPGSAPSTKAAASPARATSPAKARVVVELKSRSSFTSLKPTSSVVSLKPESNLKENGKGKAKPKALAEVVDSSVDWERDGAQAGA